MLFRKSTSALIVLAATVITGGAMIVSASTSIDQLGADIDGEAADDRFGVSVSLSDDGTFVAIGGGKNDAGATDGGHVRCTNTQVVPGPNSEMTSTAMPQPSNRDGRFRCHLTARSSRSALP